MRSVREVFEDMIDKRAVRRRRNEDTVPFEQVRQEIENDGR